MNLRSFEQGKGGEVYTDVSFMRRLHPKGMPQSILNYTKGSDIKRSQDLIENRRQGRAEIPGSKSKIWCEHNKNEEDVFLLLAHLRHILKGYNVLDSVEKG